MDERKALALFVAALVFLSATYVYFSTQQHTARPVPFDYHGWQGYDIGSVTFIKISPLGCQWLGNTAGGLVPVTDSNGKQVCK